MHLKALLLALFLLAGCLAEDVKPLRVDVGDIVTLEYTGRTMGDNLVFDTSSESIARDQGVEKVPWFKLREEYEPMVFTIGSGQLLQAFEEGLIGTEMGSGKTIVLSPEEAYGERNESKVLAVEKVAVVPLVSDIPLEVFEAGAGKKPILNDTVQLKYWPARVINITEDNVALQSQPENDTIIETAYAPARVTVNSTNIIIELNPPKEIPYNTPFGPTRAVFENQTTILLDYNHPLAGKTLVFDIVVKNITKLQKN
jgi:FKBP-type peptidyl-prolyl cis-trans isomerase 2